MRSRSQVWTRDFKGDAKANRTPVGQLRVGIRLIHLSFAGAGSNVAGLATKATKDSQGNFVLNGKLSVRPLFRSLQSGP